MKCRRAHDLLFDFVDGVSNEALRAELDRHVGECPACEKFARELTQSLDLVHRAPAEPLDENFNWRVRLAIHHERNALLSRASSSGAWVRAWSTRYAASAGGAFALVLVAGVALLQTVAPRGDRRAAESTPASALVATKATSPAGGPAGPIVPDAVGPERLVSSGGRLGSSSGTVSPGAIDVTVSVDSLIDVELQRLTHEARADYLRRQIDRLQTRLADQGPGRP